MTQPVSAQARLIFHDAFERFTAIVTSDHKQIFTHTTLRDVMEEVLKIQLQLQNRRSLRNLNRLEPFFRGIEHYSRAAEVLCNGTPYLPWIWAPVKLMLAITVDSLSVFEKLIEAYGRIADVLPRFDRLTKVFSHGRNIEAVLALVYADILEFHRHTYKFLCRKSWAIFFSSMWASFESRFDNILRNLAYHSELVDKEAVTIDISDAVARSKEEADKWDQEDRHRDSEHLQRYGTAATSLEGYVTSSKTEHIPEDYSQIDSGTGSDNASTFSDNESVWSVGFTESSQSSYGDVRRVTHNAAGKMAEVLWESTDLHTLYLEASIILPRDTFMKNHDNILKSFFEDLRFEVANDNQLKTIRILRNRSHRQKITDNIYNLACPKDENALKLRKDFLDQRESRDEILQRYLQPQAKTRVENNQERAADSDPSDEESEDEDEGNLSSEELRSIVKFFTSGLSFGILRMDLFCLAHPETAIVEALRMGKIEILQALLTKQFNRVAIGEYAWLKELDAAGYTKEEIAQLLLEESTDSPWIYFTPRNDVLDSSGYCDLDFHTTGCVHGADREAFFPHQTAPQQAVPRRPTHDIDSFPEKIQELCGVAGISHPHEKSARNGSIQFFDGNTVADVTYASPESDCNDFLSLGRTIHTLKRLLSAARYLQDIEGCCNSFSVITHHNVPLFDPDDEPNPVELHTIRFVSIRGMLSEVESLLSALQLNGLERGCQRIKRSDVKILQETVLNVLGTLGTHNFPHVEHLTLKDTIQFAALAAQFASLAFLSYNQAHVGPIQPFFLDTAQKKIMLLGAQTIEDPSSCIVMELTELTCMGNMLRAPVMVFSVQRQNVPPAFNAHSRRYDIVASAVDLIDTWGPGNLVVPQENIDRGNASYAIQIGGGVIYLKDAVLGLFHWTSDAAVMDFRHNFTPRDLVRIGALVTMNANCHIDERESWTSSTPAFEFLGVQDSFWKHDESQIGGQAGQYALLQYNRTKHKIPGISLKTVILQKECEMAIDILNQLFGLQVSFCTGVARRVPLRVLMADLLPVFAEAMPRGKELWDKLQKEHGLTDVLHTDSVQQWFENLPSVLYDHVFKLMRKILVTLGPTGIDEEGKYLTVAWVYQRPPFRCFRIPCDQEKTSWMRVLADSTDCATFAYITTTCLETSSIKCRGPSPLWHNTAPLLETAVLRHNNAPNKQLGPLKHKKTYFFRKMDALLQVTVEKQQSSGLVALYVSPSGVPDRFKQRLYRMEVMRDRFSHIRERREFNEPGAESVAILTKSDAR